MFDDHRLFYMAPMQNAGWIAVLGIQSYNKLHSIPELREVSVSIADPFVNSRRHYRTIDGRSLHDFVPLYWATHTPMQYVVTIKERKLEQNDLVFFVLDAQQILALPGVWTTDGNAASSQTTFYQGDGAVAQLDWSILNTPDCWSKEYKWRKCAEVLVPDMVHTEFIREICVYDQRAAERLCKLIRDNNQLAKRSKRIAPKVIPRREYYY